MKSLSKKKKKNIFILEGLVGIRSQMFSVKAQDSLGQYSILLPITTKY